MITADSTISLSKSIRLFGIRITRGCVCCVQVIRQEFETFGDEYASQVNGNYSIQYIYIILACV